MFRRAPYRALTLVVLASYGAAGTLGAVWHEHLHEHAIGESCPHAIASEHCHHDGPAGHDHREVAHHEHGEHEGGGSHDDDCSVCRLLGQRVLAPLVSAPPVISRLCEFVEPAPAVSPALALRGVAHSRAPPALG